MKTEYKHRSIKEAIFALSCLANVSVSDHELVENLVKDCEKELELYDDLKKKYAMVMDNEIALKALEIIKRKRVDVGSLVVSANVETYNELLRMVEPWQLTQDEFDLLNEVLE